MPSGRSSAGNSMPREGQLPPVIVTREGWLLLIHLSRSAAARPVGHRTAGTSRHLLTATTRLVDSWMGYLQVYPPGASRAGQEGGAGVSNGQNVNSAKQLSSAPRYNRGAARGRRAMNGAGHALSGFRSANIVVRASHGCGRRFRSHYVGLESRRTLMSAFRWASHRELVGWLASRDGGWGGLAKW
jgi:hypothetical protein